MEGKAVLGAGGSVVSTTTSSRYQPSHGLGVDPHKRHILESQRKHRLIFKPDREILDNSTYPAEYPRTHVPVPEPEVPDTRGRRALNYLYTQFKEAYNRHRNVVWFNYIDPRDQFGGGVWVAPSATVIGNVWLGDNTSVWYNAVLRGDKNEITVGEFSNIQDGVIITVDDKPTASGTNGEVSIGAYTTIGHSAVLQSCIIGDLCVIGMNSTIMEGAVIENGCVVAAGAVVPPGRRIPAGEMWAGKPARFIRKLDEHHAENVELGAHAYRRLALGHDLEFTTHGLAYKHVEDLVRNVESALPDGVDEREPGFDQWKTMGSRSNVPFWRNDREF